MIDTVYTSFFEFADHFDIVWLIKSDFTYTLKPSKVNIEMEPNF